MSDVLLTSEGEIDWNANGWPEPNPEAIPEDEYYTISSMPDDIFDEWQYQCDMLRSAD